MTTRIHHLYATVLLGGMTTLALELAASRLLGRAFGSSNLVWTCIIGLILLYLAAGYTLGGRWADQTPHPVAFYQIAAWAALLSGLIPLAAQIVLPALSALNLSAGAAAGAALLLLFTIPVTLLGCLSPFSIRLAMTHVEQAGQATGRIYAVSTLGSIIGALAPVLYLLPQAGVTSTFLLFASSLLITALSGLLLYERRQAVRLSWMLPVLLGVWLIGLRVATT